MGEGAGGSTEVGALGETQRRVLCLQAELRGAVRRTEAVSH